MPHDIRKLCFDVITAIREIREFTAGLDFDKYRQNRLLKLGVEREFEIIGEALKRIQIGFADEFMSVRDGRKIIDFRNLLSHGYDSIADEIVWSIIENDIDILERDILAMEKSSQ